MNLRSNLLLVLLFVFPGLAVQFSPALAANDVSNSSNWAGYVSTGGKFTSVSGTWTVPLISGAPRGSADTIWVGIGGVKTNDLIQAGTQAATDSSGQTTYKAWYEMLPQTIRILPVSVSANDSVTVSVAWQSGSQWLVSFKNNTTGANYQNTFVYESSLGSAEWIVEAPSSRSGLVPLDNFGAAQFTDCYATKDGKNVSIAQSDANSITMLNAGKQALAVPLVLGSDGSSFAVSRTSALPVLASGSLGVMHGFRGRGNVSRRLISGFYWFRR